MLGAIDWIQAEGDFARIHRSAIVNCDRIREILPKGSSRHTVVLADGTRLVLNRSRADRLRGWRL